MKYYTHIPSKKTFYKVTEGCCYEVVSYDKLKLGIAGKIDKEGDLFNSYDLICRCDLNVEMIESSEEEYKRYKKLVMKKMR